MAETLTTKRPPQLKGRKITEVSEEHKASLHRIDKKSVNMKAAEGTGEIDGGIFRPTDEQVVKINQFTRSPKTADEVVAFTINSCNDIYDRDDERFTTQCVNGFAALEPPYSFVGKSYMADHEYKIANVRGRLFDVGAKTIGGTRFLTNDVFTPNTEQYKNFIENLDFGMNWAVSVGVVVDKALCSICQAPVYTSRMFGWSWCDSGHEKGYFYVPGEEEDDGWGWFLPVDPSTKGAVKAMVDLSDPIDGYEISQVFLGAQYMAELAKSASFKGLVRDVTHRSLPVIGLSREEAKSLPLPHENEAVVEARAKYQVDMQSDGSMRWKDGQSLIWTFNPEDGAVLCLGKSENSETDDEEVEDEGEDSGEAGGTEADSGDDSSDKEVHVFESGADGCQVCGKAKGNWRHADTKEFGLARQYATLCRTASRSTGLLNRDASGDGGDAVALAEQLDSLLDETDEALEDGEYDQAANLVDTAEDVADQLLVELGGTDADEHDDDESSESKGGEMENTTVVAAAEFARLPQPIIDSIKSAKDNGLRVLAVEAGRVIRNLTGQVESLTERAAIGDQAFEAVKSEALHWFTMMKRDPKNPKAGVNVDLAQKLIERAGDDIELIKSMRDEWKDEARKRFPTAIRRSSLPQDDDPNGRKGPGELPDEMTAKELDPETAETVRKIHG